MKIFTNNSKNQKGFTLLELLIVIGIVAILSVALVFVLNPAEALKKSRDSLRMSDLNTLKKAIEIYKTNIRSPKLAGTDNEGCKGTPFSTNWQPATDHIYYSLPSEVGTISKSLDGITFTTGGPVQVAKANAGLTNGNGWMPINFSALPGGSPISNIPIDPTNSATDPTAPTSSDLIYRYICSEKDLTYEINATLESQAYTTTENKAAKDGGNSDSYYEVGTGLALMSVESPAPFVCGDSVVGPDTLTYGTVVGADTKCWLDRNLGATRVAISYNDSLAYGHLYQWGRGVDGHQIRTSGKTSTLSTTDSPGHGNFITTEDLDWRSTVNDNLWQGVNGINNPCPTGFRLPTTTELQTLFAAIPNFTTATCGGSNTCRDVAFNSTLKLPTAGQRSYDMGSLFNLGGYYWSSNSSGVKAYNLIFDSSSVGPAYNLAKATGFSVRCIKN